MAEILTIEHERVDDIPVIIGVCSLLGLARILNRHLGTHGLQRGRDNGQLASGWLAYILSQADHVSGVLYRLSDDEAWAAIEQDLWAASWPSMTLG